MHFRFVPTDRSNKLYTVKIKNSKIHHMKSKSCRLAALWLSSLTRHLSPLSTKKKNPYLLFLSSLSLPHKNSKLWISSHLSHLSKLGCSFVALSSLRKKKIPPVSISLSSPQKYQAQNLLRSALSSVTQDVYPSALSLPGRLSSVAILEKGVKIRSLYPKKKH